MIWANGFDGLNDTFNVSPAMNLNGISGVTYGANRSTNTSFVVRLPLAPQASACIGYRGQLDGSSHFSSDYCVNLTSLTPPATVPPYTPPNQPVTKFSPWSECVGQRFDGTDRNWCEGDLAWVPTTHDVYQEWALNDPTHAEQACPPRTWICPVDPPVVVTPPYVPFCGNGIVDWNEACDGTRFRGHTCLSDYGTGGDLACRSDCTVDNSGCGGPPGVVTGPNGGSTILPRLPGAPATRGSLIVP